uniref:WAP domain-containing protein n=1 Tax=Falco tinnunculus TaxID=100819 RepID=A0A8C4TXL6_FALTI
MRTGGHRARGCGATRVLPAVGRERLGWGHTVPLPSSACAGDWQCPGPEKCCSSRCGYIQTRRVPEGGVCPVPRGCGMCLDICSLDKECPWGYKCCSNGCGHVCMRGSPAKGWSH